METNKRRSSLRKSIGSKSAQKRRISFCGKKSVRVFSNEEEAKAWNKSFELLDHLNDNDAETNLCVPSTKNISQSSKDTSHEVKETFLDRSEEKSQTSSSLSNFSTSNWQIGYSVDITLYEKEKRFQKGFVYHDDIQKLALCGEKTSEFIPDLVDHRQEEVDNKENIPNNKSVNDELINHHSEHKKIGNETMFCFSKKSDVETFDIQNVNRKSVYKVSDMQLTFNETQQHDKKNLNLVSAQTKENLNKINTQQTTYFDEQIQIETPTIQNKNISTNNWVENIGFEKDKTLRPSIYFNKSIEIDEKITKVDDYSKGAIPKIKPTSDSIPTNSQGIQKNNQPSKIIFRKIRLATPNRAENFFAKHKERILRNKKEEEQQKEEKNKLVNAKDTCKDKDEPEKINKSLNFSLHSENSSPVIPVEYQGYTLKQLNDEIECGKIKVFPNAPNPPIANRKKFNFSPAYRSENINLIQSPIIPKKKSLIFDDADMPKDSDLPNKGKYRYSQADEMMLDNTSFLARAKLSDDTMSHKSSKRDSTQFNDSMDMDIFDETLAEAENKLEDDRLLSLKIKKICNQNNNSLSGKTLFDNNISIEIPNADQMVGKVEAQKSKLNFSEKPTRNTLLFETNIPEESILKNENKCMRNLNKISDKQTRKTLHYNEEIPLEEEKTKRKTLFSETEMQEESILNDDKEIDNISGNLNPPRKTIYYNHDISIENPNVDNEEEKKVHVVTSKDFASTNSLEIRKTFFHNSENHLVQEATLADQNRTKLFSKQTSKESLSELEGHEQMDLKENNCNLSKPARETSLPIPNVNPIDKTNTVPIRRTICYNSDIPLENILEKEKQQINNTTENNLKQNARKDCTKRSIYFNSTISGFETQQQSIKEKVKVCDINEETVNDKQRKTLFFETKIQEESILNEDKKMDNISDNFNRARKTLYYDQDISLENPDEDNKKEKFQVGISENLGSTNSDQTRKHFFNNKNLSAKETILADRNGTRLCSNQTLKEGLWKLEENEEMDMTENNSNFQDSIRETLLSSIKNLENKPINKTNIDPIRKTIYYNNDIQLENILEEENYHKKSNLTQNTGIECARKTIYFNSKISGFETQQQLIKEKVKVFEEKRKSVFFGTDMEEVSILHDDKQVDNISDNFIPARRTLYYNHAISLENPIVDNEEEKVEVVTSNDFAFTNSAETRKTTIHSNENLSAKETTLADQNRTRLISNQKLEENLTELKENEQMNTTESNCNLSKSVRETLLPIQNVEPVDKTNIAPIRKTIYYDNDTQLENISDEEIDHRNNITNSNLPQNSKGECARKTIYFNSKISRLEITQHPPKKEKFKVSDINEETVNDKQRKTLFFDTEMQAQKSMLIDDKEIDNVSGNLNTARKTLYDHLEISLENSNVDNTEVGKVQVEPFKDFGSINSAETTKGFLNSKENPLSKEKTLADQNRTRLVSNQTLKQSLGEIEDQEQMDMTENNSNLQEPIRETLLSAIKNVETKPMDKTSNSPIRKTIYYNNDIPLENILDEENHHKNNITKKNLAQNLREECLRKTIYFNRKIPGFETQQQPIKEQVKVYDINEETVNGNISQDFNKTDNPHLEEELMDYKDEDVNMVAKCDNGDKNQEYQIKLCAPRRSVYTPEMMDLTLNRDMVNKTEINETNDQLQMPENVAYEIENKQGDLQFQETEQISLADNKDTSDEIFKRNFSKNAFATPKGKNLSFCMTPRLSLLEFKRLERQENEERENHNINHKRSSLDLTPIITLTKKRHALAFDDCLREAKDSPVAAKTNEDSPQSVLAPNIANVCELQSPSRENSCVDIPISNNSFSLKDTRNSYLQIDTDNFGESIQLIRKDVTFKKHDNEILKLPTSPEQLKPSGFEGNPITISDVSVFFEAQGKSHIQDITETAVNQPLKETNSLAPQSIANSKRGFEGRFIHLTLEDLEKTHLSLVRDYEDVDDDNIDPVNELKQECQAIKEQTLEVQADIPTNALKKRKPLNSVNYLRDETLVCRKCKRCQETFINETTSSTSESFVMPDLPPLPDLGLDRLRRLRKRPTVEDVCKQWECFSLERTICNANISEDESDDEEEEDKNSAVAQFIEKFRAHRNSFEERLQEKLQSTSSSAPKLPFYLRLQALLKDNCPNWIFDYQKQIRGMYLFKHRQLYTFTLQLTFEENDDFGYEITLKSIQLGDGHWPKKCWKPIDFVLEFQLKLNLPFDMQSLCKSSSECDIFQMLQQIDRICVETVKQANDLQQICFSNQASIKSFLGGGGTYVRKIFRQIVDRPNTNYTYVKKTEIHVELLNLKKLSFKDIILPQLHNFREDVHLLPTGLDFLRKFLPNALDYLKEN